MIVRHTLLILALAAVAGCGSVSKDSKIDYRTQAAPQRPLDVPPELSPLPPNDRYAVPQRPGTNQAAVSSGLTQKAAPTVALEAPGARIERAGAQRWLVVDVSPEQAFETVRAFFQAAGLKVALEEPALGILETDWAENRAKLPQDVIRRTLGRFMDQLYSTGELDKFRARIERVSQTQSEIFVTHRGMVEVYTSSTQENTRWQPRAPDPELEAEMLRRLLLQFLKANQDTVSPEQVAAATAQQAPVSKIASMVRRDAQTQLEIKEPFDRAWRRIGLALDRGGFTVEDRDRAQGIYFVRYIDPEYEASQREEQGFFSKVFGTELKIKAQQFRVWVQQGEGSTYVSVQDQQGKPDRSETADKILKQIYEQLR